MTSLLHILYRNKFILPEDPNESFEGCNIIVTGSNVGLGFEAAAKFAKLGASRLILAVRTLEKGQIAKEEIEQRSGNALKGTIEVWQLEMASYDSIKAFVARAETELPTLDIAVLNAGIWMPTFEKSGYGWERMLQIDTLSTTLLALLLLPKLRATKDKTGAPPTMEIVGSGTIYRMHSLSFQAPANEKIEGNLLEHFNKPDSFSGRRQYAMSKLFLQCAVKELAKITSQSSGTTSPDAWITSVCPGFCQSEISRALDGVFYNVVRAIVNFTISRTTEQGSRTLVSGTTLGEKGHGEFWQHDEIQETPPMLEGSEGEEFKKRVWSEILDALMKDVPDLKERARI